MKKIIASVSFVFLFALTVSAQHAITASHVVNHIGEKVVVIDSIYAVKIYNDSTAVIDLGKNGSKTPVKIVFNFNSRFRIDPASLNSLDQSILEVTGLVISVSDQPEIVVTNKDNLYFISQKPTQKWLEVSQVSDKKK